MDVTLTFRAGDRPNTVRSFTIPITDDDLCEDSETVNLQASVVAPGPGEFTVGGDTAVVIITNDDGK